MKTGCASTNNHTTCLQPFAVHIPWEYQFPLKPFFANFCFIITKLKMFFNLTIRVFSVIKVIAANIHRQRVNMSFWKKLHRELRRHLTVMFIPHATAKPLQLTFSVSFLLFLIGTWTALTLWAGYLSNQHIDYWRINAENKLMKLKVVFFAQQIRKSQEMLDEVRDNDMQIRTLLEMKSKKDIIEYDGKGGPTKEQTHDLSLFLAGKLDELTQQDIFRQTSVLHEETRRRLESFKEVLSHVEHERALYKAVPCSWPCMGSVTSTFGYRTHPLYNSTEFHSGLDIANARNTPVYATAYGTVHLCDWQPGYGRLIIVDHGYGYRTYFGHLQKIMVKPGEHIKRGQLIGLMGDTGTSTGDHLHYEIQVNGQPVNPARFLKKHSGDIVQKSLDGGINVRQ